MKPHEQRLTFAGILVTSDMPITLQVASVNDLSSDAYLALPRSTLGTDYVVTSYLYTGASRFAQGPSQFVVIANHSETTVEVRVPNNSYTLLRDLFGVADGVDVATIHLDEFQAYQVRFDAAATFMKLGGSFFSHLKIILRVSI